MIRPIATVLALVALASGCSATARGDSPGTTPGGVTAATIGIDGLPEPLTAGSLPGLPPVATEPADTVPPTTGPVIGTEPGDPPIESGTVGQLVDGNRLLIIGDSIFASTASRFEGVLCAVLADSFGWSVEIHAETGQHIEFATTVLDDRLDAFGLAGFDAVAVMLGNNYRGNYDEFTQQLEALLDRIAPRPTVLFTLTEKQPDHARLNDYIRWRTYFHPNVIVVDWAELTADEPQRLLAGDGLHLSDEGRGRLVMFTAAALGEAPDTIGRPACVEHVQ
ncbi:MAG TPA: SGNH/GDSL hydrolase family protein [Ilumatobacter sp.]|nr:SGNH/GDSL hydrolase family protein [Ilumatobacter sp.]